MAANVQVTLSLPVLKKGSEEHPSVQRVQMMLNFVGRLSIAEDGLFGPEAEKAVRDFQENQNLVVDKIVGKQTWTTLLTVYIFRSQLG
jgi:peptidoglycan hydrolase-like protein with peptidoglycan-binding domain